MSIFLTSMFEYVLQFRDRVKTYRKKRVLVHEILSLQIMITAVVGALAVAGLYWGGQWVLKDNYSRWAMQWTEELNELGAPLYLLNDDEAALRQESFINKYRKSIACRITRVMALSCMRWKTSRQRVVVIQL